MIRPKKIWIFALTNILPLMFFAQRDSLVLVSFDSFKANAYSINPLSIVHCQFPEFDIKMKLDGTGRDTFWTKGISRNYSVDPKFPLKTLYFFKDINKIQVINSRNGVLCELNLDLLHIYQPSQAVFSSDEMIWVFDQFDNTLYKVNENNQIKFKSSNSFMHQGISFVPNNILDFKNQLYVLDTSQGLLILNNYGEIDQVIWSKKLEFMVPINNSIWVYSNSQFYEIRENKLEMLNIAIEKKGAIRSIQVFNKNWYILREAGLSIYRLKLGLE